MKSVWRIIAVVTVFGAVVVGGLVVTVWLLFNSLFGLGNVTQAHSNLRQAYVLSVLALNRSQTGKVVFKDGRAGWFVIDAPATLDGVTIGVYGVRMGEALFGGRQHVPVYCGEKNSKIIWHIIAGQIKAERAYCNRRRMDLSNLRPFARPVDMHEQAMTRSEVEDLQARITADPESEQVTLPQNFQAFDAQRRVTLPAIWYSWTDGAYPPPDFRMALDQALEDHMAAHADNYAFTHRDQWVRELTQFEQSQVSGPALNIGGTVKILPDADRIELVRYDVTCTPEACAALDGFDPSAMIAPYRDLALLERTVQSAVAVGNVVDDAMHTLDDLRTDRVTLGEVEPITYNVRWTSPRN